MLRQILLVLVLFRVGLRAEETHVLGKVCEARESPGVGRRPGVHADGRGEVLRLRVMGEEDGDAVVEEERAVGPIVGVAFYDGREVDLHVEWWMIGGAMMSPMPVRVRLVSKFCLVRL